MSGVCCCLFCLYLCQQLLKSHLTHRRCSVNIFFLSVGKGMSWRRQWHPTAVLLPGKSHGRRSLLAAVHGVMKSWTQLSDFTFTFHFHALKKEMATHSSVLAWRIPGTGKPGGLPSMGLHRVGHDWSDLAAAAAAREWVDNWNYRMI